MRLYELTKSTVPLDNINQRLVNEEERERVETDLLFPSAGRPTTLQSLAAQDTLSYVR